MLLAQDLMAHCNTNFRYGLHGIGNLAQGALADHVKTYNKYGLHWQKAARLQGCTADNGCRADNGCDS